MASSDDPSPSPSIKSMTPPPDNPSPSPSIKSMTPPPDMCEVLRIVLLGKNSSEISRVGNFILGRDAFDTEAPPPSVEQHSERAGGRVEGRYITLITTPHLFHPQLSVTTLDNKLRECLSLCSPGPHVLVLVLQPDDFTETDRHRLDYILRSLSDEDHKHTLVLTTKKQERGSSVDPVQENMTWMTAIKCSSRHLEWSECSCVDFVEMIEKIVEENGGSLNCEKFDDAIEQKEELDKHHKTEQAQIMEISEQDEHNQTRQQAYKKQYEDAQTKPKPEKTKTSKPKQLWNSITKSFTGTGTSKTPVEDIRMEEEALPKKWNLLLCGREIETKATVSKLLSEKKIEVCGRLITLVELPALYSSQLSEQEVMRETLRCVSLCDPGVHAFLLVLPEGRLTDDDKGELEKIQMIFGSGLKSLSLVLIAQQSHNKQLDEAVKKMINSLGGRYHFFDIKTDAANLMTCLKKLLRDNGDSHYTMAMYCDAQVETQLKYKKEIENLQKEVCDLQIRNKDQQQDLLKDLDTLRIVLLGKTGVGKSATGNTILGKKVFKEDFGGSVTIVSQKETAEVNGRKITVIDTPGLFDTNVPNEVITKEITKCISMAAPGPHVFLLVLSAGQRFTQEEQDTVKMIQDTFGERSKMFTIVLFTRVDGLNGKPIEEYIEKSGAKLQRYLLDFGNRHHVFNNNNTNYTQVTALLKKIDSMVKVNGGSCYTNEMFQKVEEALQQEQERILKERKEEIEREKEELITKHEAELEKLRKQMQEQKERQETADRRKEDEFKEREQQIKKEMTEREQIQREDFKKRREADEKQMKEWIAEINREREETRKQWEKQREDDQRRRDQEEDQRRKAEEDWKKKQSEEKENFDRERESIKKEKENQQKLQKEYERKKQEEERRMKELGEKIKNAEESKKKELQEQLVAQHREWERIKEEEKKREEQKRCLEKKMASIDERNLQLLRKQKQYEWEKQKEMEERELKEKERKEREEKEKKRIETEANEKLRKMEEQMKAQREKEEEERRIKDEKFKKEMEDQLQEQRDILKDFIKEKESEEQKRLNEEKANINFLKENHEKQMKELKTQTEQEARKQAEEHFNAELDEKVNEAKEKGFKEGFEKSEAERTRPGRGVDKVVNWVCGSNKKEKKKN